MSKTWGPHCWNLFHTLANRIKEEYFESAKEGLWSIVTNVCYNLPCPDCRMHATNLINNSKKNLILSSKRNFELFLFDFHNLVNKRKGYKIYTIEEYNSKYSNINISAVVHNFIIAFSYNPSNIRQMSDNFQRSLYLVTFKEWINLNHNKFV
jgi:hypothetical protein